MFWNILFKVNRFLLKPIDFHPLSNLRSRLILICLCVFCVRLVFEVSSPKVVSSSFWKARHRDDVEDERCTLLVAGWRVSAINYWLCVCVCIVWSSGTADKHRAPPVLCEFVGCSYTTNYSFSVSSRGFIEIAIITEQTYKSDSVFLLLLWTRRINTNKLASQQNSLHCADIVSRHRLNIIMNKSCARCSKVVYPIEELKCLDKVCYKYSRRSFAIVHFVVVFYCGCSAALSSNMFFDFNTRTSTPTPSAQQKLHPLREANIKILALSICKQSNTMHSYIGAASKHITQLCSLREAYLLYMPINIV